MSNPDYSDGEGCDCDVARTSGPHGLVPLALLLIFGCIMLATKRHRRR